MGRYKGCLGVRWRRKEPAGKALALVRGITHAHRENRQLVATVELCPILPLVAPGTKLLKAGWGAPASRMWVVPGLLTVEKQREPFLRRWLRGPVAWKAFVLSACM